MSNYVTVNLKTDVAAHAREIAFARGIPLTSLIADLIKRAYVETFGADALKAVEVSGDRVLLKLRGAGEALHFTASRATALNLAGTLKNLATGTDSKPSAHLNLDSACMLTVMRKGTSVIIEATMPNGEPVRKSMSTRDANSLADEIKEALI